MAHNVTLLVYPVKDLEKAKAFYGKFLDAKPYADSPYYVGYKVGDLEIGLALDGVGPIAYTDTKDIKGALQAMVEAGGEVTQEPKDVAAGLLIAQVKDVDGNVVGFRQNPKQ
jgi:predicted enzyme related to lactoylglutathione lyase